MSRYLDLVTVFLTIFAVVQCENGDYLNPDWVDPHDWSLDRDPLHKLCPEIKSQKCDATVRAEYLRLVKSLFNPNEFRFAAVIQFLNVPAEELSEVSLKHQIEAVPTVLFIRSGSAIDRIDGVDIASLSIKCKSFVEKNTSGGGDAHASLDDRLKALINRAKVMIFMKGERSAPRCGFSKQLIAIINETKVAYETFDILSDEEVRQGLKVYSDWPTYPQVYVNGELIGGLDIIKELVASNELSSTLSG